ncbi:MAG TPA: dihydrofolate reductase [Bacteroidota bacterium]|nr:dihydrofolate reductase [Bacteroidota bacterium]
MKLILIAALNRKRVIGIGGKLPWHISEDLKRFRQLTTGHVVLMGRRTFESLGKPLPRRRNVVLTSRALPGVETYPTLASALEALRNEETVFVIGGGKVFNETLALADELKLTIVENDGDGDTYFPPYEHLIGREFERVSFEPHDGYAFADYVRKERNRE